MTTPPNPREALRACPFCGGNTFLHHGHNGIGFVTCGQRDDGSDGCGAVTSFRPNKGGRDAIAAWNLRAAQPPAVSVDEAKDAARLDWLERYAFGTGSLHMDGTSEYRPRALMLRGRSLRAAIDAALNPETPDMTEQTKAEAGAKLAELEAERDTLRVELGRAWSALVIAGDCAGMLATLQETGVYRPRCSDGKPSNADARRDYRHIADTAKRIYPLAFPPRPAAAESHARALIGASEVQS